MSADCLCEYEVHMGVGFVKVGHSPLCPVHGACACGGTAGEDDHVGGCPNGGELS